MRSKWMLIGVALLAAVLAIGAVACGDDDDGDGDNGGDETPMVDETPMADGSTVNVDLTEWQVVPDVDSVAAGSVTFNASNVGGEIHELVIIQTDLAPDALPTGDDGGVDEAGEGINVIAEIEEFDAGTDESLTVDLDAGAYVLICNIVEEEDDGTFESHYQEGMRTAFTVNE